MERSRTSGPGFNRRSLVKGAAAAGAAAICVPALGANGAPVPAFQALSLLAQEGTPGGTLYVSVPFDFTATINPMVGNTDAFIFSHLPSSIPVHRLRAPGRSAKTALFTP